MNKQVEFDGKIIGFQDCGDGAHDFRGHTCPLCGLPITTSGLVVRMLSSEIDMPNRLIHNECLAGATLEHSLNRLVRDWREAQQYRHWFITGRGTGEWVSP